jgi:DNA-binding LytR/AlgR family response regulator
MLDINLGSGEPGEDGFALAALLNAHNPKPFIFLTAYNDAETIRRAAALLPCNYLIKPVNPAALFAAIQVTLARTIEPRMQEQTEPGDRPDYFYIKVGSKTHRLSWDDIYCIESGKNYVKLFARDNAAEYPVRGTITFVLDRLVPPRLQQQFFRISRSICLNKAHVTTFSDNFIFCGGRSFPNTRFSVEELYELFEKR